jgi:hypothetical protein
MMSEPRFSDNRGIIQTGGIFKGAAVATGDYATASTGSLPPAPRDLEDLRRKLGETLDLLRSYRGEGTVTEEVITSAEDAAEELEQEHPRKPAVIELLEKVTRAVEPITGLATSVGQVLRSVESLL